ncbi:MAG: hypothetical protein AAFO94_16560 [Bacteroidota bacterium]
MNYEALIEKYFSNRLSADEQAALEARLQTDKALRKAFEYQQNIQAAISAQEHAQLKLQLSQLEQQTQKTKPKPISQTRRLVTFAIAASILFAFWALTRLLSNTGQANPESIYAQYFESYPNVYQPVVRGNDSLSAVQAAFAFYESEQYEQALEGFRQILQEDNNTDLHFYTGLTLMELQQFAQAIQSFDTAGNSGSQYADPLLWYRALAKLRLGQYDAATADLKQLRQRAGYKATEAQQLESSIEALSQ